MFRHASSGMQIASSSLSKISSASALSSFRACSAATRLSHGASWRSPASLRTQTRTAALVLEKFQRKFATIASEHAYKDILTTLHKPDSGEYGNFYSLPALKDPRIDRLPYSVRILLESAIRNCDNFHITKDDVERIMDWENTSRMKVEIPFKPARVMLPDFTGVPVLVDLAAMRDAMKNLGDDPNKINPRVPVDLVFDHSVQVYREKPEILGKGMQLESDRNWERFMFLKWGSSAFNNMVIASPDSSIVHQVDLEYLRLVVCNSDGYLYPDSVVGLGTYSNTGLGVAGWEVGELEAVVAILGQPISVVLPSVVGFKLVGKMRVGASLTDLVPTVTHMLRKHGVVGSFVEFYGDAMSELSLDDRAKIAMMCPEYGAIMGFFPVDHVTLEYLKLKGRSNETVAMIESYLRTNKMFVDYNEPQQERAYTSCLQLDLGDIEPCIYGPKRTRDRVLLKDMKADWKACLDNPPGIKGFAIPKEEQDKIAKFSFMGQPAELKHGSVVIAIITCGTKTIPSDVVGAALVAKNAYDIGLKVKPWVRTSVSPGYGVVKEYLLQSGLQEYLDKQGFQIVGQRFTTSIWGSGDLDESTASAISENDIVATVLSSSIDFQSRPHAFVKANYLASPPLVVAYAFAGTVNIDFETEPIGTGKDGKNVYLIDIWPSSEEVTHALQNSVLKSMFKNTYETITKRNSVSPPSSTLYSWDSNSTYVNEPPYFKNMASNPPGPREVKDAYCLLKFGDNITTDHISPAGVIHKDSPAAKFLIDRGHSVSDFNSYGSRRGNHEVMTRGTFASTRIVNELLNGEVGPKTVHIPTGEKLCVFDAASRYKTAGQDTIILAGAEYGVGNSRDWAAKGPKLLGVKTIIAKSFDRVHRSNLASIGIVPLCFKSGEDAETLGLTGHERYTIHLPSNVSEIKPGQDITVTTDTAKSFACTLRLDSKLELAYYDHGGMLPYIIRNLSNE